MALNRSAFNIIHTPSAFKVYVFVRKDRDFDRSALARVSAIDFAQTGIGTLRVLSPEDIILHKREWYRLGGEISDRQWNDILGVIQVQEGRLDYEYRQKWARDLCVTNLLTRALAQAANS